MCYGNLLMWLQRRCSRSQAWRSRVRDPLALCCSLSCVHVDCELTNTAFSRESRTRHFGRIQFLVGTLYPIIPMADVKRSPERLHVLDHISSNSRHDACTLAPFECSAGQMYFAGGRGKGTEHALETEAWLRQTFMTTPQEDSPQARKMQEASLSADDDRHTATMTKTILCATVQPRPGIDRLVEFPPKYEVPAPKERRPKVPTMVATSQSHHVPHIHVVDDLARRIATAINVLRDGKPPNLP